MRKPKEATWHPGMAEQPCGCGPSRQCAEAQRIWTRKTAVYRQAGISAEYGKLGNEYRAHTGRPPVFCEHCGAYSETQQYDHDASCINYDPVFKVVCEGCSMVLEMAKDSSYGHIRSALEQGWEVQRQPGAKGIVWLCPGCAAKATWKVECAVCFTVLALPPGEYDNGPAERARALGWTIDESEHPDWLCPEHER